MLLIKILQLSWRPAPINKAVKAPSRASTLNNSLPQSACADESADADVAAAAAATAAAAVATTAPAVATFPWHFPYVKGGATGSLHPQERFTLIEQMVVPARLCGIQPDPS